jgi:hypothetical protein
LRGRSPRRWGSGGHRRGGRVALDPEGSPSLLYVQAKSKNGITVEIKKMDVNVYGDVEFSYQVTGVRDGFENQQAIVKVSELVTPIESAATKAARKKGRDLGERVRKLALSSKK